MKPILITGCNGFIGSYLVERLLKDGRNIVGIDIDDSKESSYEVNKGKKNFMFKKIDILDKENLRKVFENNPIHRVIHLAEKSGARESVGNPSEFLDVNVKGTLNILELAKEFEVEKVVYKSSVEVYGNIDPPFKEDKTPKPVSPYGVSKLAGEELCATFYRLYGLRSICLRLFNVFGPRLKKSSVMYQFLDELCNEKDLKIFGEGNSERDFVYIDDAVSGICRATTKVKEDVTFHIVNIGTSTPLEINKLLTKIADSLNKTPEIYYLPKKKEEIHISYADISYAIEFLNWSPRLSFNEGLRKTIEWFEELNGKPEMIL